MTYRQRPARRWWLAAVLAAVLALVAGACGGGDDDGSDPATSASEDEGEPVDGGRVIVGVESETNSYAPWDFAGTQAGVNAALAIYDPLMVRDEKGEPVPYLAESVKPNADLTRWTVKLRPGVTFHDGTKLTATVQKTAFDEYLKNAGIGSRRVGDLRDVTGVEVVDELTYVYVLSQSNAAFSDLLVGPIGWPFSVEAAKAAGKDFGSKPVGTGPFVFASWVRDQELVVEKNPDYWQDGLPHLDEIVFRPIPDEDARLVALEGGAIDATHSVRLSQFLIQVRQLAEAGTVKMYEKPGNSGSGSIFNVEKPPLDDLRIRKALALSLDPEALIAVVAGEGATEPRRSFYPENSRWHSEKAEKAYPANGADEAKRLLQEYVDDPERSDGKQPGEPVQLSFNCTAIPSLQAQAQAYQAQWERVGFSVDISPVEQSAHIQNAITGQYMINCWRQGSDADPYTYMSTAFGDPAKNPANFTNYTSLSLQAALEDLRAGTDFETRYAALERIQLELAEQVPVIWTGGNNEFVAVLPKVKGVDSWVTPDSTKGEGAQGGTTMWGQVWVDG